MHTSPLQALCAAAGSVGTVLLHQALFSIIVGALVWAVLRLWPQAPPRWRMALWSLVLLRLVLPASLAHPLTARAALDRLTVAASPPATGTTQARSAVPGPGEEEARGWNPFPPQTPSAVAPAFAAVWVAGVVFCATTFLRRYLAHRRVVVGGRPLSDGRAWELASEWRQRLRVRREVGLVAISSTGPPFTVGVWRPVIAIPDHLLADRRPDVLETVVAHEMAHIRRLDELSLFIVKGLQAFYFFNPAAWLAGTRISFARECLCDSMVLAQGTVSPARYGRSLLAVLEACPSLPPRAVLTLGHAASLWEARLRSLRPCKLASRIDRLAIACTLAAACVLLLPMAGTPSAPIFADPLSAGAACPPPDGLPTPEVPNSPSRSVVVFVNPVPGSTVTSGFGPRINPVTGKQEHHSGIDLAAAPGTPVLAAAAGIVTNVTVKQGQGAEAGVAVRVVHNPTFDSFYAFLTHPLVREGESVAAGQPIGSVGTSAGGVGPHLHFVIRKRGRPVNPRTYLE